MEDIGLRLLVRMVMMIGVRVVLAGHARVERREHATRIFAIQPHMTVVMRLEIVRFIERRGGIVDHGVIGNAVK
jgi:hypothetical protein